MYAKVVREWSTELCALDAESCTVSTLLPCHVYAKLRIKHYGIHFLSYALFILCIRNIYSTFVYYHTYKCPSVETTQCFYLEKEDCQSHFMSVNGVNTPCLYHSDYDLCIYRESGCIQVHPSQYTWLSVLLTMCYLCLFCMNYSARKEIHTLHNIEPKHECVASSACSICGLAQAYREIV
jgi:hypothetical protein